MRKTYIGELYEYSKVIGRVHVAHTSDANAGDLKSY